MTIAVGILCSDGVVLGADREHSLTSLKVDGPKAHIIKDGPYAIGLVGSGTTDLLTFAAQELGRRIRDLREPDYELVRLLVKDIADTVKTDYVTPNEQRGFSLDVLVGIKISGGTPKLLKVANGLPPIWIEDEQKFQPIGWGSELAHYLLDDWYGDSKPDVRRGIVLMAHALKGAKDYAQGCGGRSDILYLKPGFVTTFVPEEDILLHESSATRFAEIIKPVMMAMTDIGVSSGKLETMIQRMTVELNAFRPNAFTQQQVAKSNVSPHRPWVSINGEDCSSAATSVFGDDTPSPEPPEYDDE